MKYKTLFVCWQAFLLSCLFISCKDIIGPLSGGEEQSSSGETPASDSGDTGPRTPSGGGSPDPRSGSYARRMQTFVEDISRYSRNIKPNFIIIPQNAEELAFVEARERSGVLDSYLAAIDGFGVEELFFDDNGEDARDPDRVAMLRGFDDTKKVFVADYVRNEADRNQAILLNQAEGFIPFPRERSNYEYEEVPPDVLNPNNRDIERLFDAQNYLYLINDAGFSNKKAFLAAIAATSYDMVIIDLYHGDNPFSPDDLEAIRYKANGGRRLLIAYVSVGSAEEWRDYFGRNWSLKNPAWLYTEYDGWEGEYWVQFWHEDWRDIMFGGPGSYFDNIINAGFDGAYLDNVEAYLHVRD